MGHYFVYKYKELNQIKIYHAKNDADVKRAFSMLDTEPDKYENISNFVDEYDAIVRFCRADFARDVVDALNKIVSIYEIPVRFKFDFGRSNASGGWMVYIINPSEFVKRIEYTEDFYRLIKGLLRGFDQEVSFVGAEKNRFIFSEVLK